MNLKAVLVEASWRPQTNMRRTDTSFPPSAPVHSRFFFFNLNPERPVALICIRKKSFSAFPLCRMKSSSSQGGGGGGGRGAEMGENNGGPPFIQDDMGMGDGGRGRPLSSWLRLEEVKEKTGGKRGIREGGGGEKKIEASERGGERNAPLWGLKSLLSHKTTSPQQLRRVAPGHRSWWVSVGWKAEEGIGGREADSPFSTEKNTLWTTWPLS